MNIEYCWKDVFRSNASPLLFSDLDWKGRKAKVSALAVIKKMFSGVIILDSSKALQILSFIKNFLILEYIKLLLPIKYINLFTEISASPMFSSFKLFHCFKSVKETAKRIARRITDIIWSSSSQVKSHLARREKHNKLSFFAWQNQVDLSSAVPTAREQKLFSASAIQYYDISAILLIKQDISMHLWSFEIY